MNVEVRREKICEVLTQENFHDTSNLAKMFRVSESTIRRDLQKLAEDNHIKRTYGGAIPKNRGLVGFDLREPLHYEEKERIGKAAGRLIDDGNTIFLDAGTTTTHVAKYLISKKNLTVITNALNIASYLGKAETMTIILLGGKLIPEIHSLVGPIAEETIKKFNVDKAIIATAGIDLEAGLTNSHIEEVPVKQLMLKNAKEVIVVADSSKFGNTALSSLIPLNHNIHKIVTDEGIDPEDKEVLEEKGIEVVIA